MVYKSILTVWDGRADSRPSLDVAIALARNWDAHLNVLCLGIDHVQVGFYYAGASPSIMAENVEAARDAAKALEAEIDAILNPEDINWSCQSMIAEMGGISWSVGQVARFNDLVILPQPYGKGASDDMASILEAALFDGDAPVLVYPTQDVGTPGKKPIVSWDQSASALRAVKCALPFLRAADMVEVAVIDPPRHDEDMADPGMDLSKFLAHQGVDVDVAVLARTLPKLSETLQQHALDIGADMIVAGAYGHSRLREAILGGPTRDMLEHVTVPVLMAH